MHGPETTLLGWPTRLLSNQIDTFQHHPPALLRQVAILAYHASELRNCLAKVLSRDARDHGSVRMNAAQDFTRIEGPERAVVVDLDVLPRSSPGPQRPRWLCRTG